MESCCSDAPDEASEHCLVTNGKPAEAATDDAAKEDASVLKLHVPDADDEPDARPSAEASEVDAQPIGWSGDRRPTVPLSVPSARGSLAYDLAGRKRVIVFNQKNFAPRLKLNPRNGTEVDVRSIESTFKSLDWEVATYTDSTVAQIRDIILKQVQMCEDEVAALAIFVLSHGEDNGTIFAADYPFRVDHDVLAQLTADKCPGLVGRPKLIFVQACQGQETDQGTSVTDRRRRHTSQDSNAAYKIPNYADFLIFQASFWDHYSFRSSETGSWFIQALCSKIDRSGAEEPLLDVLLTVSASVALEKESNVPARPGLDKKKQVPLLYSTMLRKIYLKGPPSLPDSPARDSAAITEAFAGLGVEGGGGVEGGVDRRAVQGVRPVVRPGERGSRDKDCRVM